MHERASLRGSKLPLVLLPSLPHGTDTPLLVGRGPQIIAALHSPECAACRRYAQELAEAAPHFAEWGGRLVVVVPGCVAAAGPVAEGLPGSARLLADPHGALARWGPALIVADEWGEVFLAASITDEHDLPTLDELVDWTKYVAIQCEECEMPEGDWKSW